LKEKRKAAEGSLDPGEVRGAQKSRCVARRAILRREEKVGPLRLGWQCGSWEWWCRDPSAACRKQRGTPVGM